MNAEELERLYWDEEMSITQLATHFKLDSKTIRYFMKKYRIARRTKLEATKKTKITFKKKRYLRLKKQLEELGVKDV